MVAVGRKPSGPSRTEVTGRLAPFRYKMLHRVAHHGLRYVIS